MNKPQYYRVPVGFEEKGQLVTVKLVLRVNHIHGKQTLTHFAPAYFKHLVLFFTLRTNKQQPSCLSSCV